MEPVIAGNSERKPAGPWRPHLETSPTKRAVLLAAGWLSVGTGLVGVMVPVLPTTCFLLLAGACFAKSSPRAWHWLHDNRVFGRYLRDYREARVIPLRVKAGSLGLLWVTIGVTLVAVPVLIVRVIILGVAVLVTAHVATTASRRMEPATRRFESEPAAPVA